MEDKISKYRAIGKMLYMLLNEMADVNGIANISHRKISKILGIHKSTVSKNLKRLEKSGDIYIRSKYTKDGGRLANEYIVR